VRKVGLRIQLDEAALDEGVEVIAKDRTVLLGRELQDSSWLLAAAAGCWRCKLLCGFVFVASTAGVVISYSSLTSFWWKTPTF
jgi:hypothetical protein